MKKIVLSAFWLAALFSFEASKAGGLFEFLEETDRSTNRMIEALERCLHEGATKYQDFPNEAIYSKEKEKSKSEQLSPELTVQQLPIEVQNKIAYYVGHESLDDFRQRVLEEASTRKKQDHYLKWISSKEVAIMEKTNTLLQAALKSLWCDSIESFTYEGEIALWRKKVFPSRIYTFYNGIKHLICVNRSKDRKEIILSVFDLEREEELIKDFQLDPWLEESGEQCTLGGIEFSRDRKKMVVFYRYRRVASFSHTIVLLFSLKSIPELEGQKVIDFSRHFAETEYRALNDQGTRVGLSYTLKGERNFLSLALCEDTEEEYNVRHDYVSQITAQ